MHVIYTFSDVELLHPHLMRSIARLCLGIFADIYRSSVQNILNSGEVDFEQDWKSLSSSLREIHTKNASTLSFEELYRNAYKLVLKKKGEPLYNKVKEFEQNWLTHEVRTRILDELPSSLLAAHNGAQLSAGERRDAGEKLLRSLKLAWEDHNLCMNMTTDVLMYMVSLNPVAESRLSLE